MSEAAQGGERFAAAHRALAADPAIQFRMAPHAPSPPPTPPEWLVWLMDKLKPVGRFFDWLSSWMPDAPWARIILWGLIAAAAAFVLVTVIDRVRHGAWRWPTRQRRARDVAATPVEEEWAPAAAPARAWLEEADALAARGRYAEALHHLLFRSIEDIAQRRPQLARPSLTSREIAAARGIPAMARALFAGIAGKVERSLFGGHAVGAEDWRTARAAYADFALPGQWRG